MRIFIKAALLRIRSKTREPLNRQGAALFNQRNDLLDQSIAPHAFPAIVQQLYFCRKRHDAAIEPVAPSSS